MLPSQTVQVRYVGPSRRPITIAATGHVVIRDDAPLPPLDPEAGERAHPAVVADVPPDVAERLLAQPVWERADDWSRHTDVDEPAPSDHDLAGAVGDDPTDDGPEPADQQEE
jgi:hypothetical protein